MPVADIMAAAFQLERSHRFEAVRALRDSYAAATPDLVQPILEEAAKFAASWLAPLNERADAQHCRMVDGRVRTAEGHAAAWNAYVEAGWPTLDQPEELGGQGLPLAVAAAVQEVMDRSCPAFGMLPVPQRSASRLIAAWADDDLKAEWLPRLASGEWGATICISEADAGSDAGRIRTRAAPNGDGSWSITGEKCWISYGDHDLTPRIGHCLLARTPGAKPGGGGLSLFLVPDSIDGARNGVAGLRVEHKMGLNGSPTCVMGFDGARGWMLGQEGKGLAQMFVMITNMRLSVGVQGLGIAAGATDIAFAYAAERRQGGPIDAPVTIDRHPDVRRMLMDMRARVTLLRGLIYALANLGELAGDDPEAAAFAQWLLPIVKTLGGETGFDTANDAIQVLGGAGYTREWPVEQALRDARVLTIFEGTTGIQALDLVNRRLLKGDRAGYTAFVSAARTAAASCPAFAAVLTVFERASADMLAADPTTAEAGATAYLRLAGLTALGWIAAGYTGIDGADPVSAQLAASARYWLHLAEARAGLLAHEALNGAAALPPVIS